MNVGSARKIVHEWILKNASLEENYRGAYFSGSVLDWADHMPLIETSDIDVMVIIDSKDKAPPKLGKFMYRNVLIEITYLNSNQISSAEKVLADYHLASSFRTSCIIDDPTGYLNELQAAIHRQFATRLNVEKRCQHAFDRIQAGLSLRDTHAPLHEQVTSWLFPTSIATHAILVAALRNPTTRTRYLAARETLSQYGHATIYNEFIHFLGCTGLTKARVEKHLDQLSITFDAAAEVAATPFFFRTDITPYARKISIDGSRALIHNGDHREAIFWIVATFARCHAILAADAAPEVQKMYSSSFEAILADLGIYSTHDLTSRSHEAINFLPVLKATTQAIMDANSAII